LVVWDVEDESIIEKARKQFGIVVWCMDLLIFGLQSQTLLGLKRGSRDDVMRTIELISQAFLTERDKRPIEERVESMEALRTLVDKLQKSYEKLNRRLRSRAYKA
jgi:hypothetical protein